MVNRCFSLVSPEHIGLGVRVRAEVRHAKQTRDAIYVVSDAISAMHEVIECVILFGEWYFQVTVVARDVEQYQIRVLVKLAKF